MIYLLTPTGGRQDCIDLLSSYLREQSCCEDITWLVIDDVCPATVLPGNMPFRVVRLRPPWRWKKGENTQARSLNWGLGLIENPNAKVLIIEDDEVYLPGHVSNIVEHLDNYDLAGEKTAKYYNVKSGRYKEMNGGRHCALASCGLKGPAISALRKLCVPGSKFIDSRLWKSYEGPKIRLDTSNVFGIKGMPGRPGIGVGHRPSFGGANMRAFFIKAVGARIASKYERFAA